MLAGSATAGSSQQHRKEIMPFLGETREHFEARKRGLPLPAISNGEAKLVPDRMGHFVAETTINGEKVRMLVDTGASFVSLSPRDAELLGLRPTEKDFIYRMQTANGIVKAAPVPSRDAGRRYIRSRRRCRRSSGWRSAYQPARHVVPEAPRRLRAGPGKAHPAPVAAPSGQNACSGLLDERTSGRLLGYATRRMVCSFTTSS
jgi:hypothetical protein